MKQLIVDLSLDLDKDALKAIVRKDLWSFAGLKGGRGVGDERVCHERASSLQARGVRPQRLSL